MCGLEDEDLSCRGDWGSHWCCPLTKHRCYLVSACHVMCVWLSTHSSQLREHPALWFRCCDLDYPGFPIVYYVFRQMLVSNWEAWGFGLTLSRGAGQLESTFPKGDRTALLAGWLPLASRRLVHFPGSVLPVHNIKTFLTVWDLEPGACSRTLGWVLSGLHSLLCC